MERGGTARVSMIFPYIPLARLRNGVLEKRVSILAVQKNIAIKRTNMPQYKFARIKTIGGKP